MCLMCWKSVDVVGAQSGRRFVVMGVVGGRGFVMVVVDGDMARILNLRVTCP